ncbi:hypothetical protein PM082_019203 [Marasmius tenuissimus]|nr:hypothetical protein PM082_019203 [Marasmius tenuissimus]
MVTRRSVRLWNGRCQNWDEDQVIIVKEKGIYRGRGKAAPHQMSSPVSSTCSSSSFDSFSAENVELEMFLERESRVLEIVELPPETFRDEFFSVVMCRVGPATLWSLRGGRVSRVWAVFPSHQEVSDTL